MEVRGAGGERRRGALGQWSPASRVQPVGWSGLGIGPLWPGDPCMGRPAVDATRDGAPPPLAGGLHPYRLTPALEKQHVAPVPVAGTDALPGPDDAKPVSLMETHTRFVLREYPGLKRPEALLLTA